MWQDIWSNKGKDLASVNFTLTDLIYANGYESSGFTSQSWVKYFQYVANTTQINEGKKSILEIGCGGGASLKAISLINDKLEIFGLDYSKNLINIAKSAIKGGKFYCDEAINIDKTFPKQYFDTIILGGVIVYFPSEDYTFEVIKKSYNLLSQGGNLALLDLNDINKKSVYSKIRKGNMTEDEYNKKYEGLNHLFLNRTKVFKFVESLGFKQIIVEDQHIDGYINNECRFNVFALSKK